MPLISIIIPTRDRPKMLAEALASVQVQTFRSFEIVVVSNGEPIEVAERSFRLAALYGAKWISLPDGNVSAARNAGIAASSGEWIAFLDDDDIWLPQKLEQQIEAAKASGANMIVCDRIEVHDDGREILVRRRPPEGFSHHKALCHGRWFAIPSAAMVKKAAIVEAGGFDPELLLCEDGDLWRRIAWRGAIHEINEVLLRYRRHPEAISENRRLADRYDLRHSIKLFFDTPKRLRHEIPGPITLVRRWLMRKITPKWARQPRKFLAALRPAKES